MVAAVMELALALGAEEDETVLLPLCTAAVEELTLRLKAGLTCDDCGSAFLVAATWLALDGLEQGGLESFSAGDISVKARGEGGLRQQAELLMVPYLAERGFAFRGVNG